MTAFLGVQRLRLSVRSGYIPSSQRGFGALGGCPARCIHLYKYIFYPNISQSPSLPVRNICKVSRLRRVFCKAFKLQVLSSSVQSLALFNPIMGVPGLPVGGLHESKLHTF